MAKGRKKGHPRPGRASTAKGTKSLPSSAFAYPRTREYPINTKKRARAALSYSARSDTSGSYSHVARAVKRKYGGSVASVGGPKGKVSSPGLRKSRRKRK